MSRRAGSSPFHIGQEKLAFFDNHFFTYTSTEQKRVEDLVRDEVWRRSPRSPSNEPRLNREKHIDYLMRNLREVGKSYMALDASRTWLVYWTLHSLNLLGASIDDLTKNALIRFLKSCEHPDGGYGGGPEQLAHLAPTYAAVFALISLQSEEALRSINRESLLKFLKAVKNENGSFSMHIGGEADMRGAYCALAVAAITRIINEDLVKDTAQWIISCQTYEGGFGGVPSCEAHGGYTYCAVAALALLSKIHLSQVSSLLRWLVNRQMRYEGGFQGRTNKLVDGCYSFWQAAVFRLIDFELNRQGLPSLGGAFDYRALEEYIIIAAQDPNGGLRDKPDKARDLYHSCYVLSGLSIAQSYLQSDEKPLGGEDSRVETTHPVFNVVMLCEEFAARYFAELNENQSSSMNVTNGMKPKSSKTAKRKGAFERKERATPLVKHQEGSYWYDYASDAKTKVSTGSREDVDKEAAKARLLLARDVQLYEHHQRSRGGSEAAWLQSVLDRGTHGDRLTAMQLQIRSSPVHSLSYLKSLVNIVAKKNMRESLEVIPLLEELFVKEILPPNRKLIPFGARPVHDLKELSSGSVENAERQLILWAFEHDLILVYEDFVQALKAVADSMVEKSALVSLKTIVNLLAERPQAETFLLTVIVNKLGHPKYKVASRAASLLLSLSLRQPRMRQVIVLEVERLIYRPNIIDHAHVYACTFLSQVRLDAGDGELAAHLLSIYIGLFKMVVARKQGEKTYRLLQILLTGANRALPFAKDSLQTSTLLEDVDTLYKVLNTTTFAVSLQTLKLLHQLHSLSDSLSDRFYTALYRRCLDQIPSTCYNQFLMLMFKVLKEDSAETRVRAFVKRLLQTSLHAQPSFATSLLFLVSRIRESRPNVVVLKKKAALISMVGDEKDEDEHYEDMDDDGEAALKIEKPVKKETAAEKVKKELEVKTESQKFAARKGVGWIHRKALGHRGGVSVYDPNARNPLFVDASECADVELCLLSQHYHPSVAVFAQQLLQGVPISYKGDPLVDFTTTKFLDRFVYRNPKKTQKTQDGRVVRKKAYEPWGVKKLAVTSKEYLSKKRGEIPPDERYLHRFATIRLKPRVEEGEKEDFGDIESINSNEFEVLLNKFEPGEKNEEFDIDFSKEFSAEKKGKTKVDKRKREEEEEEEDEDLDGDEDEEEEEEDNDDEENWDDEDVEEEDDNEEEEGGGFFSHKGSAQHDSDSNDDFEGETDAFYAELLESEGDELSKRKKLKHKTRKPKGFKKKRKH